MQLFTSKYQDSNFNRMFAIFPRDSDDVQIIKESKDTIFAISGHLIQQVCMATSSEQNNNNTSSYALWQTMVDKDFGLNALHLASGQGHEQSVRKLIEWGNSVNEPTNEGRTALCISSHAGFHGVVLILLKSKADANQGCNNGWTSLMSSSLQGHLDVTKLLLQYDVNVNARTCCGYTALMIASENCRLEIMDLLHERGAHTGAKTKSPLGQMQSKKIVKTNDGSNILPRFNLENDLNYCVMNVNIDKVKNLQIN
nr:ankyrin-1-like; partial [Biomphalaria glabrata]